MPAQAKLWVSLMHCLFRVTAALGFLVVCRAIRIHAIMFRPWYRPPRKRPLDAFDTCEGMTSDG